MRERQRDLSFHLHFSYAQVGELLSCLNWERSASRFGLLLAFPFHFPDVNFGRGRNGFHCGQWIFWHCFCLFRFLPWGSVRCARGQSRIHRVTMWRCLASSSTFLLPRSTRRGFISSGIWRSFLYWSQRGFGSCWDFGRDIRPWSIIGRMSQRKSRGRFLIRKEADLLYDYYCFVGTDPELPASIQFLWECSFLRECELQQALASFAKMSSFDFN